MEDQHDLSPADRALIAAVVASCAHLQRLGTADGFKARRDGQGLDCLELWADNIANQAAAVRAAVAAWRAAQEAGGRDDRGPPT